MSQNTIPLPNNCSRTEFVVHPKNWETNKASLTETWYFQCRFFDPDFADKDKYGKQVRIKNDLNRQPTLTKRRELLGALMTDMEQKFAGGFNPYTNTPATAAEQETACKQQGIVGYIPPKTVCDHTNFIEALRFAAYNSGHLPKVKIDIFSILNKMLEAAEALNLQHTKISALKTGHLKQLLVYCLNNNDRWSPNRYNKAKAYISPLLTELIQYGVIEYNISTLITKLPKPAVKVVRFRDEDIPVIYHHLYTYHREFFNYTRIFYYSGARSTELLKLQGSDVDLANQRFETLIKKGGVEHREWRTIPDQAMFFWINQMENCGPNDYLFSYDLKPGPGVGKHKKPMSANSIDRRWKKSIMIPLGIDVTFYKFKHRAAEKTTEAASIEMASNRMAHVDSKMAQQVYAMNHKRLVHESMKKLEIVD